MDTGKSPIYLVSLHAALQDEGQEEAAPSTSTTAAAPAAAAPILMAAAAATLPPGWHEALDPNYNHPYWYGSSVQSPLNSGDYCCCLIWLLSIFLILLAAPWLLHVISRDTSLVAYVSLDWAQGQCCIVDYAFCIQLHWATPSHCTTDCFLQQLGT